MELKPDIIQQIDKEYSGASRSSVQVCMQGLATLPECQRVARCVLFLAKGDAKKIVDFVTAALTDYRDVIWWAEYDGKEERLRDLSRPFTDGR